VLECQCSYEYRRIRVYDKVEGVKNVNDKGMESTRYCIRVMKEGRYNCEEGGMNKAIIDR
jgi:hypothetical protein